MRYSMCIGRDPETPPPHQPTMSYVIEVETATGWHDDPTLLGPGCSEADNVWQTEREALDAITQILRERSAS